VTLKDQTREPNTLRSREVIGHETT